MTEPAFSEITRLEKLWGGEFGNEYVERNQDAGNGREQFWKQLHNDYPFASVLEVGCNIGANLHWLAQCLPAKNIYGVDINENALTLLKQKLPSINVLWSPARELPFRDRWFDLVFTAGVLIHQPQPSLPLVMAEIVRCAKHYVLCAEYHAEELTEIPYRNQRGALFKQDYGRLYLELFPELTLVEQGFLSKSAGGWDDVTFWIFRKAS